jgi:DHA2 family multidrug resistance protein
MRKIELRLIASFAFLVFSGTALWSAHFDNDANYGYIILPRLVQGIGVACFFVPLQQIILSGMKPSEVAAASGLANFFRTLAQSIATAVTTTLYDHRSNFHHAVLTENIVRGKPIVNEFLTTLAQRANRAPASPYQALDRIVDAQAQTLALNELFWVYSFTFLFIGALIWLAKPPFDSAEGAAPQG